MNYAAAHPFNPRTVIALGSNGIEIGLLELKLQSKWEIERVLAILTLFGELER